VKKWIRSSKLLKNELVKEEQKKIWKNYRNRRRKVHKTLHNVYKSSKEVFYKNIWKRKRKEHEKKLQKEKYVSNRANLNKDRE
jgi:phosphopantetheine adenylyltransferase